jgi:hypothetical protein
MPSLGQYITTTVILGIHVNRYIPLQIEKRKGEKSMKVRRRVYIVGMQKHSSIDSEWLKL